MALAGPGSLFLVRSPSPASALRRLPPPHRRFPIVIQAILVIIQLAFHCHNYY